MMETFGFFPLSLLVIIYADFTSSIKLFFPTTNDIHWHDASASDIVCPTGSLYNEVNSGVSVSIGFPTIGSSTYVDGTLCVSVKLITTCDKGFFGGESVTYHTDAVPIGRRDCSDAIASKLAGRLSTAEHLPPTCSWLRVSSVSKLYVETTPHRVLYDPYRDLLLSTLFQGGTCNTESCNTAYDNRIWLVDSSVRRDCSEQTFSNGSMTFAKDKDNMTYLWSPDFKIVPYDKPCVMKFCGLRGLRFSTGNWIRVNKKDIPNLSWIGEYLYTLKDCPQDSAVNLIDTFESIHNAEASLLDEFIDQECSKTRMKLVEGQNIARVELQAFIPRTPGTHPVYRYTGRKLEVGISYYQLVDIKPDALHPFVSITADNKQSIAWPYWLNQTKKSVIEGPNGLFILNKNLIYGMTDVELYKKISRLSSHHVIPLVNKDSVIQNTFIHSSSDVIRPFYDDTTLSDIWSHHFYYTIVTISVLILIIYLGLRYLNYQLCPSKPFGGFVVFRQKNNNSPETPEFYQP